MSFDNKGFTPIHVNAGPLAPRVFGYVNMKDLLSEIMKPGYFNSKKIIMRPNSFIKVVCQDAIAEIVVESNTGEMTIPAAQDWDRLVVAVVALAPKTRESNSYTLTVEPAR